MFELCGCLLSMHLCEMEDGCLPAGFRSDKGIASTMHLPGAFAESGATPTEQIESVSEGVLVKISWSSDGTRSILSEN